MSRLLLLNGPNLGILGQREPEVYGKATLADIEAAVAQEVKDNGWDVVSVQRESEGELIQAIQSNYDTVGAIVNPGALMIMRLEPAGRARQLSAPLDRGPSVQCVGAGAVPARVGDRATGQRHRRGARGVRVRTRGPRPAEPDKGLTRPGGTT